MSQLYHNLSEYSPYNCKIRGDIMEILFENGSVVVCVKPVGTASQGDGKNSMISLLRAALNVPEIYPVHRLDTVASGIMVYAKTEKAASELSKQISNGTFSKEYVALVHNTLQPKSGIMEDFLFKDSKKNKSFVVTRQRKGVKKAVLEYSVIKEYGNALSLVQIKLHTGRTHQIRVQFSHRGCPVFGDGKYGASDNISGIALFANRLSFIDPESGEKKCFEKEIPDWDFLPVSE